jgi:hypothetical protein
MLVSSEKTRRVAIAQQLLVLDRLPPVCQNRAPVLDELAKGTRLV